MRVSEGDGQGRGRTGSARASSRRRRRIGRALCGAFSGRLAVGRAGHAGRAFERAIDHLRREAEVVGGVGEPVDRGAVDVAGHRGQGGERLGQRAAVLVDRAAGVVDHVVRLLAAKMRQHKANAWLVNTGWSGGAYGTGARMKLKLTRAIITAIHSGELAAAPTARDPVFGFDVPTACAGVPADILIPRNTWSDKNSYDATAKKLAGLFADNFAKYESGASAEVRAAGPLAR